MRRTVLFALPVVLALALAGCGKDNNTSSSATTAKSSSATTTTSAGASSAGTTAIVKLSSSPFGQILTDSQGNTLYVFMKDTGTTSTCTDACATVWPPQAVTGTPAGTGITASDLGTTTRPDGSKQLTFFGHPVYRFARDTTAGQTNGQGINGFGGLWYVVSKDGSPVTSAASTATTMAPTTVKPSSSSSGGGY